MHPLWVTHTHAPVHPHACSSAPTRMHLLATHSGVAPCPALSPCSLTASCPSTAHVRLSSLREVPSHGGFGLSSLPLRLLHPPTDQPTARPTDRPTHPTLPSIHCCTLTHSPPLRCSVCPRHCATTLASAAASCRVALLCRRSSTRWQAAPWTCSLPRQAGCCSWREQERSRMPMSAMW